MAMDRRRSEIVPRRPILGPSTTLEGRATRLGSPSRVPDPRGTRPNRLPAMSDLYTGARMPGGCLDAGG